jgi:hypothetical protein
MLKTSSEWIKRVHIGKCLAYQHVALAIAVAMESNGPTEISLDFPNWIVIVFFSSSF